MSNRITQEILNDYCIQYSFYDTRKPVIVTCDNRSSVGDFNRKGWGVSLFEKNKINFVSILSYNLSWYQGKNALLAFKRAAKIISDHEVKEVVGYAGSMGGFALGAYSHVLGLTKLIAFNPISTLNNTAVPWEDRFRNERHLFTDNLNLESDWQKKENCETFIFYDPLNKTDGKHVKRILSIDTNVSIFRVFGADHGVPIFLNKIGVLKKIPQLIHNKSLNKGSIWRILKSRRKKTSYYNNLLSNSSIQRSKWKKNIILVSRLYNAEAKEWEKYRDLSLILERKTPEVALKLINLALDKRPDGRVLESIKSRISQKTG